MYCTQCENSCHDPCQEVAHVAVDIHQCIHFEPSSDQISRKKKLEMAGKVVQPGKTLLGVTTGGFTGLGLGVVAVAVSEIALLGLGIVGAGLVIGGIIGGNSGRKSKERYLQKAAMIYCCHVCGHTAQEHMFNRFPQDHISKKSLKTRDDLKDVLQSLKCRRTELTQLQKNLEEKLNLEEKPSFLLFSQQ